MCNLTAAHISAIARLREIHLQAARLFASGETVASVAAKMSWSLAYTNGLITRDPAFRELVTTWPKTETPSENRKFHEEVGVAGKGP